MGARGDARKEPNLRAFLVEIYGPESSGKTTLALHVIAEAQRGGGTCAFIDAEHALDVGYARKLGVRTEDLLLAQPDCGEQALEITDMLVRSSAVDVVVIDSVAALVPKAEIEGEMGDSHVGLQARLMSQALRKLTGSCARSQTLVFFINQLRMKIGVMFGSPETTTGGNALKFYASVRLDIRRIGAIKEGERAVGNRTKVKVVKNKLAAPFREVEFDVGYGQGISLAGEVVDLGVEAGLIDKSGAWMSVGGERIGQGREAAKQHLTDHPELLRNVSRPDLLPKVGLVVVDELQIITDEARGPTLELLLTKILSARPRPRIVGLSAVLGRAQLLADWLGAKLLVDTRRPVELRKGVLCKGVFTYREHNSGAQGTEAFSDCGSDKRHEILLAAARDLVGRGEQVLVFLPDRASTVAHAQVLAERVRQPAVTSAIEELREQEDTHARGALVQVLGSSVAFHNSDLSRDERELVERHFRSGGVRALFSTSTLAMGMNLPVRNVLMDSRFEVDVWLRHYVDRDFEDIVPTLKDAPLEDHVLNLLASHLASSRDGLAELLLASYTGFAYWNQKMSRDEFLAALDAAIARCVVGGMVREAEGKLLPTDVGRAGASKGLGVATTAALAAWAREAKKARHSDLEVLAVLSLSPAASDIHVSLSTEERFAANYRARLLERATREGCADRPVFERLRDDPYATEYEVARSLKKALLLADWIDEVRAKDIERTYRVWAGTIGRIGEEYSWLVDALAAIAGALDWPDDGRRALSTLADRLVHGIRADAAGLSRVRVRGLGRVHLRRLVTAGLAGEEALAGKTQDELRVVIGNRRVAAALWERLHTPSPAPPYAEAGEETHVLRAAEPAPPGYGEAAADPPVLRVDLGARTVEYRGVPLPRKPPGNLQPMVFRAFAVLAQHPGEVIGMARLAEEMLALGDLTRRPMAPEQRELRYRIVRALRSATKGQVPAAEIEELIESVPRTGLRLRAPGRVEVLGLDAADQSARRAS